MSNASKEDIQTDELCLDLLENCKSNKQTDGKIDKMLSIRKFPPFKFLLCGKKQNFHKLKQKISKSKTDQVKVRNSPLKTLEDCRISLRRLRDFHSWDPARNVLV